MTLPYTTRVLPQPPVYEMRIEKPARVVTPHGFHLGTDRRVAESFVLERLRTDPGIMSIALWFDGEIDRIYDFQDLDNEAVAESLEAAQREHERALTRIRINLRTGRGVWHMLKEHRAREWSTYMPQREHVIVYWADLSRGVASTILALEAMLD